MSAGTDDEGNAGIRHGDPSGGSVRGRLKSAGILAGVSRDSPCGMQFFLYGAYAVLGDAVHAGYVYHAEYAVYNDEPDMRDRLPHPVSSGMGADGGAGLSADSGSISVPECGDTESDIDGESSADLAGGCPVGRLSADRGAVEPETGEKDDGEYLWLSRQIYKTFLKNISIGWSKGVL